MASNSKDGRASRGLATVALLKMNFDAGRDHLAMFEPFINDALAHLDGDGFQASDISAAVLRRNQLALPLNTVQTLLGRVVKKGNLRRDAGRYFFTDAKPVAPDLQKNRERVEARQRRLAAALQAFCVARNVRVSSTEDALALVLRFLEQHHVALALDRPVAEQASFVPDSEDDPETDRDRTTIATAAFLQETILTGGELADVLQEMLAGFVLQNALLLKDISTAARRFNNLRVFFDSGLLFAALGLHGPAMEVATKELIGLLGDTGASANVFEPTIREMDQILALYEERLGTHQGRQSLRPTDLTRYLLTNHFSPAIFGSTARS
jgi:predicted transcriptional regulator